ncbi:unnamed protein product [Notodromas monacha]|uniref:TIMELESS-interacting protein n=1 Tax=Notodromas monacha TaxID=399045 RepID=A0A7R9BSC1_9CRUS|nr:unnamed protein product [Notodromas monacha]CAG0919303.1 unnamed protein product [Notodromas monacha]
MYSDIEDVLPGEAEEDDEEAEEAGPAEDGENKENEGKKKIKVKLVRKPMQKLDEVRLCGDMGLSKLPSEFKDFKWLGKGAELEEMDAVLQRVQLWAHRLFPKMAFEDFLQRVENLGAKRSVQTHLRKMRMGMIDVSGEPEESVAAADGVTRGDTETNDFDSIMREFEESRANEPPPVVPSVRPVTPQPATQNSVVTRMHWTCFWLEYYDDFPTADWTTHPGFARKQMVIAIGGDAVEASAPERHSDFYF